MLCLALVLLCFPVALRSDLRLTLRPLCPSSLLLRVVLERLLRLPCVPRPSRLAWRVLAGFLCRVRACVLPFVVDLIVSQGLVQTMASAVAHVVRLSWLFNECVAARQTVRAFCF